MTTIQFCPSRLGSKPYAPLPCVSLKSRAFEALSSKNAPLGRILYYCIPTG
jgi:hypothetical protein